VIVLINDMMQASFCEFDGSDVYVLSCDVLTRNGYPSADCKVYESLFWCGRLPKDGLLNWSTNVLQTYSALYAQCTKLSNTTDSGRETSKLV